MNQLDLFNSIEPYHNRSPTEGDDLSGNGEKKGGQDKAMPAVHADLRKMSYELKFKKNGICHNSANGAPPTSK